jgi:photosystem II stability/assembly factor-like uncharacterized protein
MFLSLICCESLSQPIKVDVLHPKVNLGTMWMGEGDTILSVVNGRYILKSYDNGKSWSTLDAGRNCYKIRVVTANLYFRLDSVYIGGDMFSSSILRTENGGISWDTVWTTEDYDRVYDLIVYDKTHFSYGMVSQNEKMYWNYFTKDGGTTWKRSNQPSDVGLLYEYCGPNNIVGAAFVAYSHNPSSGWMRKMIFSSNGGASIRTSIDTVDYVNDKWVDWLIDNYCVTPDGIVYASAYFYDSTSIKRSTIVRSDNCGASFHMINPLDSYPASYFGIFAFDSVRLICVTQTGYFVTGDGCKTFTWHPIRFDNISVGINGSGHALINRLWMETPDPQPEENVLETTDFGSTWMSRNWGFRYKINSVRAWDDMRWMAACDNNAVLVTSDAGASWAETDFRKAFQLNGYVPDTVKSNIVSEGGIGFIDDFRTMDFGATWSQWNPKEGQPGTRLDYRTLAINRKKELIAVGVSNTKPFSLIVYGSTDWGNTWSQTTLIPMNQVPVDTVLSLCAIPAPDGTIVLVASIMALFPNKPTYKYDHYLIFSSGDDGMSWTYRSSWDGLRDYKYPLVPFDSVQWAINYNSGLHYHTFDAGVTWKIRSYDQMTRMDSSRFLAFSASDDAIRFYCDDLSEKRLEPVFYIEDIPFETYEKSSPLPYEDFTVEYHNGHIWLIGQGGLIAHVSNNWHLLDAQAAALPAKPALSAWYPNPSNGSDVSNNVVLNTCTHLMVGAYDVLGREVERIFDGIAGPGRKTLRWDTGAVRPGVYFIVARTPKQVISTSKVVVK